jgi:hypothetical protein
MTTLLDDTIKRTNKKMQHTLIKLSEVLQKSHKKPSKNPLKTIKKNSQKTIKNAQKTLISEYPIFLGTLAELVFLFKFVKFWIFFE